MKKTVVIFGGSGFIGSYFVRRLAKLGFRIVIPTQNIQKSSKLKLAGNLGQIIPIDFDKYNYDSIKSIISGAVCVLNLKTIWKESKNFTFEKKIFDLNKIIIDSIKEQNIKKYIFFSGIGINLKSPSKRNLSILNVEDYIRKNLKNYAIIRPSVVIGDEDKFINKLLSIFKLFFIVPVFGKGSAKIQPTYVEDVALAVEKILLNAKIECNIYELGGNLILS